MNPNSAEQTNMSVFGVGPFRYAPIYSSANNLLQGTRQVTFPSYCHLEMGL